MKVDGSIASTKRTHVEWCEHLRKQGGGVEHMDKACVQQVNKAAQDYIARAYSSRGAGTFDHEVTWQESNAVRKDWDKSCAMPPDLLPRAAFTCEYAMNDPTIWALQRLCGPGLLAVRPRCWRYSAISALFKDGDCMLITNFRLIYMRSQMGLLQEGILSTRLAPTLHNSLDEYQSGYKGMCRTRS